MNATDETALDVSVRNKSYISAEGNALEVLRDIRFSATSRELVVLTGPSGCGKSTLLNLIAGLDTDYQGEIRLPAHPTDSLPLSFVFQEPRLLPWRTVRQNLELVLPPGAALGDMHELFTKMGIENALDRYPSEISLGMARRVSLARAFLVKAPLLLMDEPFNSVDELTARNLRTLLLSRWKESPRLVLFVTHNMREALFLGCRLLVLSPIPATLLGDTPLTGEPGRPADQIEKMRDDILRRFPSVLR